VEKLFFPKTLTLFQIAIFVLSADLGFVHFGDTDEPVSVAFHRGGADYWHTSQADGYEPKRI
jgi:hypothetical protein